MTSGVLPVSHQQLFYHHASGLNGVVGALPVEPVDAVWTFMHTSVCHAVEIGLRREITSLSNDVTV